MSARWLDEVREGVGCFIALVQEMIHLLRQQFPHHQ